MTAATAAVAAALPHYEIGPELGRGGFGIVYSGRHGRLGREVAIKQLPPAFANDEEIRDRFVTEARVLASLDHPHIVPIYDYVEQDGLCLLVMECLTGGSVWDTFRRDGLNPIHACVLVIATAAGLHHAHVNGVLHRDVKPENLLLTATNHLKVSDFGIAKVIGGADVIATNDGGILGTPAYMAPEQADGGVLGPAADVYAAGTMLYELLSGNLPFSQEGGGLAIVYRHLHESPTPLQQAAPDVPAPLAEVVMRAIARSPENRYGSAEEFAVAIGEAAVAGFGDHWYSESGLRVVGSDRVMGTLTDPSVSRRHSASGRDTVSVPGVAGAAAPAAWGAPPTGHEPFSFEQPSPRPGPRPAPAESPPSYGPPSYGPPTGWADADRPSGPTGPWTGGPSEARGPRTDDSQLPVLRPAASAPAPISAALMPDVRAREPIHVVGSIAVGTKPKQLVAVRQLLDVPPLPARLLGATAVVLVLVALAALLGLGTSTDRSGSVGGTVTVGGADVTQGEDAMLDLGSGIALTVRPVPSGATSARLTLRLGGVRIGTSDRTPLAVSGGVGRASIKLGSVRYLVAGPVAGGVTFFGRDGQEVGVRHFGVERSGSGFLTIPGVVVVLALLFVLAYLESLVAPLWKYGRYRVRSGIGLALVGALLGVVLVGLAWTLGLYAPTLLAAIVCAVLGAGFGVLLGLTAAGWGLHARVKRINRRTPVFP